MGFGYKGINFCRNNGWLMKNMDKGLTVPKWVLINLPKIPQMPQNLSAHIGFLEDLKTPKGHFKTNWSLIQIVSLIYNDFACIAFQLFFHVFPTTSGAFPPTTSNNFQGSFHFAIKNLPSFVSVLFLSLLPWSHLIQNFLLGLSKCLKTFGH